MVIIRCSSLVHHTDRAGRHSGIVMPQFRINAESPLHCTGPGMAVGSQPPTPRPFPALGITSIALHCHASTTRHRERAWCSGRAREPPNPVPESWRQRTGTMIPQSHPMRNRQTYSLCPVRIECTGCRGAHVPPIGYGYPVGAVNEFWDLQSRLLNWDNRGLANTKSLRRQRVPAETRLG